MVHVQNLFNKHHQQKQNHCDGYVSHGDTAYTGNLSVMNLTSWCDYGSKASVGAELIIGDRMAEEESKSSSVDKSRSSSKEEDIIRKDKRDHDDNRWLQLGVGGHHASGNITPPDLMHLDYQIEPTTQNGTGGLLELDLSLSAGATTTTKQHLNPLIPNNISNTPLILQQQQPTVSFSFHQQEVLTWGSSYRPNSWMNQNISSSSSSFSSLPPPMLNNYYLQRFIHQHPPVLDDGGPSSSSVRAVVDPPRRPHSGVWIVLQASQNQDIEPFLPQIPKNYLRIKDGRTTVRLLTKYLVNKLRLNSESEIEIRCRGQQLVPFLTLQHVRDYIWINNNSRMRRSTCTTTTDDDDDDNDYYYYYDPPMTLLQNSTSTTNSTEKHLMILNYASRFGGDTTTTTTTTN